MLARVNKFPYCVKHRWCFIHNYVSPTWNELLKRLYLLASRGQRIVFFTFTTNVKLMLLTFKCCTSVLAQCTVMWSQFTDRSSGWQQYMKTSISVTGCVRYLRTVVWNLPFKNIRKLQFVFIDLLIVMLFKIKM